MSDAADIIQNGTNNLGFEIVGDLIASDAVPSLPWILATSDWNDNGIWDDSDVWID